jgi:glycosyltransferase involved in cell wall biosynthesis
VDDASSDNSLEILKEYEKLDGRIKVISFEKNSSQSVARNAGINIARGEYIGFVDSDDMIELDFYEKLISVAKKNNSDMVGGQLRSVGKNRVYYERIFPNARHTDLCEKLLNYRGNACIWVYKKAMLDKNKLSFPIGCYFAEDQLFTLQALFYANESIRIDDAIYNYFRNPNSTTSSKSKHMIRNRNVGLICISKLMIEFAEREMANNPRAIRIVRKHIYNHMCSYQLHNKEVRPELYKIFGKTTILIRSIRRPLIKLRNMFFCIKERDDYCIIRVFGIPIFRFDIE